MPPPRFATPLIIEPSPSPRLRAWIVLGHASYFGLICLAAPISIWLFTVAGLMGLSLLLLWRRHFFSGSRAVIRRAVWNCDGSWQLECGDGHRLAASLGPSGICHPAVIVLNFCLGRQRCRTLVLLSDSLSADTSRRLRVRLRQLKTL